MNKPVEPLGPAVMSSTFDLLGAIQKEREAREGQLLAAERARIRRELLADAAEWTNPVGMEWKSNEDDLKRALDRIVPEGKE